MSSEKKARNFRPSSLQSPSSSSSSSIVSTLKKVRFFNAKSHQRNGSDVQDGMCDEDRSQVQFENVGERNSFFRAPKISKMIIGGYGDDSLDKKDKNGTFGPDALLLKRPDFGQSKKFRCAAAWLAYLLILNTILAAIVCSIIYLPNVVKHFKTMTTHNGGHRIINPTPCSSFKIVYDSNWTLPHMYPTSSIRTVDFRSIGRPTNVVFGFGSLNLPCDNRQNCQRRGGVICFDLLNFREIWRIVFVDEITDVQCYQDINNDGYKDCIISGRSGILTGINGNNGSIIWQSLSVIGTNRRILEPQYVKDLNDDSFADLLVTVIDTKIDEKEEDFGLYLIDGKSGTTLIRTANVLGVFSMKTYVPAFILPKGDWGFDEAILSMGTLKIAGGLITIPLGALQRGMLDKSTTLVANTSILGKPILFDSNDDGFDDLVVCTSNGDVLTYSGLTPHVILWKFSKSNGQCTSPIVIGHFNNDSRLDLVVTFNLGSSSNSSLDYTSIEVIIIDGFTGKPIKTIFRSIPPPNVIRSKTLTMTGYGNDLILHWKFLCDDIQSNDRTMMILPAYFYDFFAPKTVQDLDTIDFCRVSSQESKKVIMFDVQNYVDSKTFFVGDFYTNLFATPSGFISWLGSNGLEQSSVGLQPWEPVALNISSNGRTVALLLTTYWKSISETTLYPKECFKFDNGYIMPGVQSEFCKIFVEHLESDRKKGSVDGYSNYYGSGYTVLHRVNLTCHCDYATSSDCAIFT